MLNIPLRKANRSGFTLIELLVVIAIIAILAAILFPVFAQARQKARQAACISNMKQIGLAVQQYTQDYDETYPVNNRTFQNPLNPQNSQTQITWVGLLQAYAKNIDIFVCPNAPNLDLEDCNHATVLPGVGGVNAVFCSGGRLAPATGQAIKVPTRNLGANEHIVNRAGVLTATNFPQPVAIADVGRPADLPLIADSVYVLFNSAQRLMVASWTGTAFSYTTADTRDPKNSRHNGGSTILYGDGHAKWANQMAMDLDPTRSSQPFVNQFKLPVNPVDYVNASGVVTINADERLK